MFIFSELCNDCSSCHESIQKRTHNILKHSKVKYGLFSFHSTIKKKSYFPKINCSLFCLQSKFLYSLKKKRKNAVKKKKQQKSYIIKIQLKNINMTPLRL